MRTWKRNFWWIEYCTFYLDVKNGVIRATSSSNPLVYKILRKSGNLVFASMERWKKVWYYTFSLARKELMGLIECMPVGKSYQQIKRAENNFSYFLSNKLYHPKYSFGKWWQE